MTDAGFAFIAPEVQVVRTERRITLIHHVDEAGAWATRGRRILFRGPAEPTWRPVARFPFAVPRDLMCWNRLAERAVRGDKCILHPAGDGRVLAIRAGVVYRLDPGGAFAAIGRVQGDTPLHRSVAVGPSGALYFGDYFMNPRRLPVHVYRAAADLAHCEVAHTFAAGEIRHVHGVHADPFLPGRLWVTVGDNDGENFLFFTDDEFRYIQKVGDGSQLWRTVGLLFTPDHLCWITDSPLEQNYAVTLDRRTLTRRTHAAVPSTFWYMAATTDGMYVAGSTVERGPAVQTDLGSVWVSRDAVAWRHAVSFRKDRWPMPLLKWGALSFPSGRFSSREIWVSGEALHGIDGRSMQLAVSHCACPPHASGG